jgi:hypothetical protein
MLEQLDRKDQLDQQVILELSDQPDLRDQQALLVD